MKIKVVAFVSLALAVLAVAPAQAQPKVPVSASGQAADVRLDDDRPVSPVVDEVRKRLRAERDASGEELRTNGVDWFGFLVNDNGRCLDVESAGGVYGTRIVHFDCHWGNNQLFKFTRDPDWNQWEIKPVLADTQCVDVYNNVGPDLFRHPCHLGSNQLWARDGAYWVSYLNGNVLDASGTDLRALNWPFSGAANQRWTLLLV